MKKSERSKRREYEKKDERSVKIGLNNSKKIKEENKDNEYQESNKNEKVF